MQTEHWAYLHGKPQAQGRLKTQPEDFVVEEILGYEPSGEGEHIYLWVEKINLNTAFVAEQLAKFTQLPLRAVTYAGRKDKYALTRQWFAVHKPGKQDYQWSDFVLDGCQVLFAKRHNKKLRTGNLKGNHFALTLRELENAACLEQRIQQVSEHGVPNYFGPQRFGETRHQALGGNLLLAQKMLNGEQIRNRNKRSMAISALRAWLFNEFIHQRLQANQFNTPLDGDVMGLSGTNSFFTAAQIDRDIRKRLRENDLQITAPMWGEGTLASAADAAVLELSVAQKHAQICVLLEELKLTQERRAIKLVPHNLHWQVAQRNLTIAFDLPSGAFATSVLREIIDVSDSN